MVDGVSANVGISTNAIPGNGLAGSVGSFSSMGGTNSLVSVDALQEFRIQTSTYAPEFGRTPGAQISIVTRSGTNQFHGSAFDYFRNDVLDANNWFNTSVSPALSKAEERQNDFGGTFSGPIRRERTFFFFSYEGLRLRLPETQLTIVPDIAARQSQDTLPVIQPYLNAFPLSNGPDDVANGTAQFNSSFSNRSTLDAYSVRLDHKLNDGIVLFVRYNFSPSETDQRGPFGDALSVVDVSRITTQTLTAGMTWTPTSATVNDLRFNYSRANASGRFTLDNFGGAVPLTSLPIPSPYTGQNADFVFQIFLSSLQDGKLQSNVQRQFNLVDNVTVQKRSHSLKFGVDFRRLSPIFGTQLYSQQVLFFDVPSAQAGNLFDSHVLANSAATLLFRNLGAFAQDTWRVNPRLTLTYGLRWDVDVAPTSVNGPPLIAVTGFNLNDLASLALAPVGTSPFQTKYGNVAPRLGAAYQLRQSQNWGSVVRGGAGVFYDLATQEFGNTISTGTYPFGATKTTFGGTFPLNAAMAAPPPVSAANLESDTLYAFDPRLKLPYVWQWNVALEQGLGREQSISASYIGSIGRRLIQTAVISSPNPNFETADLIANAATSDYEAMQLQFQRRLAAGLQVIASYTWSHSIDDASAGSPGNSANNLVPNINASANRGPSDFDVRNAFSSGVTYDVPAPEFNSFTNAIFRGWSLQSILQARSATPVELDYSSFAEINSAITDVRPDVVTGKPFYLRGPAYPGGKAINPAAFAPPPTDASGNPLRQGNLGRNALRGFGATQWDFAAHRDLRMGEAVKLQFRAEMFNILNHPNFGPPVGNLGSAGALNPQFGLSTQMLGQSLGGRSVGAGAFSPLYQIGGPRSIQLALKLLF